MKSEKMKALVSGIKRMAQWIADPKRAAPLLAAIPAVGAGVRLVTSKEDGPISLDDLMRTALVTGALASPGLIWTARQYGRGISSAEDLSKKVKGVLGTSEKTLEVAKGLGQRLLKLVSDVNPQRVAERTARLSAIGLPMAAATYLGLKHGIRGRRRRKINE